MNERLMRSRTLLAVFAVLFVSSLGLGCSDDDPAPVGDLARPSALAYVERPAIPVGSGPMSLRRSDLLIADSEAQGVRILQFAQQLDETETSTVEATPFFVPAPAALFQLTIDAPGFPNRIVAAPATGQTPALAFVLAPTRAQLHVLEVANTEFRSPSTSETNVRLGTVNFLAMDPPLPGTPIDIELLGRSDDGLTERAIVAFDGFGTGGSYIAIIDIPVVFPGAAVELDRVNVQPGPGDLIVRPLLNSPTEQVALVSSIATATISEVPLVASGDELQFGPVRGVSSLGPTSRLISAGDTGVYALRVDRSAAVWLRPNLTGFDRPTDILIQSPYDDDLIPVAERERGVISLYQRLAITGAYASLDRLGATNSNDFVFDVRNQPNERPRDVVFIVHADGFGTYLIGDGSGNIPVAATLGGGQVQASRLYGLGTPSNELSPITIEECPLLLPQCAEDNVLDQIICDSPDITPPGRPFVGTLLLRVSPFGTLARGPTLQTGAAEVLPVLFRFDRIEGGELFGRIIDQTFTSFDGHLLVGETPDRSGDGVQVHLRTTCQNEDVDIVLTGQVLETSVFETLEGFERAQFSFRASVFAAQGDNNSPSDVLNDCATELEALTTAEFYEVHVPDDVDEALLARVDGLRVSRVFERVPITATISEGLASTRMSFGFAPDSVSPIQFNVIGDATPQGMDPVGALGCERFVFTSTDTFGRCFSSIDCGTNGLCAGRLGVCPGRCSSFDCANCFRADTARVCPSIDFLMTAGEIRIDLRLAGLPTSTDAILGVGTVPEDAVFHEQRRSFFVSFPGSRAIVEVSTESARLVLSQFR